MRIERRGLSLRERARWLWRHVWEGFGLVWVVLCLGLMVWAMRDKTPEVFTLEPSGVQCVRIGNTAVDCNWTKEG